MNTFDMAHWVISVTEWGALVVRIVRHVFGDCVVWSLSREAAQAREYTLIHVHDDAEYVAIRIVPLPPLELQAIIGINDNPHKLRGVCFRQDGDACSLIQLAAAAAFPKMTVPMMQQLIVSKGYVGDGPMPTGEEAVCTLLVSKSLPTLSEEEVRAIVALRRCKPTSAYKPTITAEDADAVGEIIGHDQVHMSSLPKKKNAPKGERANTTSASTSGSKPSTIPMAPSHAPMPPPSPALVAPAYAPVDARDPDADDGLTGYVFRPSGGEIWTRDEASTLLPAAKGCSISIHTGKAWMVTYSMRTTPGPKSHTSTWGGGKTMHLSHKECLQQCLFWVWDRHVEAGMADRAPFDIGAL
jgi:hypothetical protein